MRNIRTSLGWWGEQEEGKREGGKVTSPGPWGWAGVCRKEEGISGNRNNTSKGMEKRNHVVPLGTGCVSKEVTGWKRNEAGPDGEELYAQCQGTWLYYRRHKGFQKGMISQKMTLWDTLSNFFSGRKIIQVSTGCKNTYEKINSRTSWSNSKGPTGYESR